nr:hypothetical protein [Tanacetum cinerariifolium]
MSSLFADTHNVVAILEKSDGAEADVTRLQALVDKKKIVISEVAIHEIMQLDDAEGVVCFPNEEIFAGLASMGYEKPSTKMNFYKAFFFSQWKFLIHTILQSLSAKRTSWNEFSTAMASAVICLSKGVETPLFEGMLAARQPAEEGVAEAQVQVDAAIEENVAEDVSHDAIQSPPSYDIPSPSQETSSPPQQPQSSPQAPPQGVDLPTHIQQILDARVKRLEMTNKVKSLKLRRLRKVGASKQVDSSDDIEDVFNQGRMFDDMDKDKGIELVKDADIAKTEGRHATKQAKKQAEIYHIDLDHSSKVLSMQEDDSDDQEVVEVVTTAKLITDVVTAATLQVSAASATISAAKLKTPKLKDKGKGILVETPKPMKKKDQIELDAEYARKLHEKINKDHEEFNKDIDWDAAIDHHAAKRRKLSEEAQEAKDLRKRLEVVDDEDDDVFIKATPLARKVPVVDYHIVLVDNKPRFKIIKADETHQLYISFTTLLKNFDREDLENL